MTDHTPLGPGREFDIIRSLVARWGERASGIGDDAAVLNVPSGEQLVVSTDSSIENVHFRRGWLTPQEIGWRATAAALSDLAAMAATPLGILLSLSMSHEWIPDAESLADGIGEMASLAQASIVGGDMTAAHELCLAITVLGHTARPLRRNGARPGDTVYLTGRLGGPLAALRAWLGGEEPEPRARERFARPIPRLREARWLERHGAHAAIDVSDGLLGDARHLAAASGTRVVLELDALPTVGGMLPLEAAHSGEEYELIVAAPAFDIQTFEREFHIPFTPIGRVESGPAELVPLFHGELVASLAGFSHFS